MVTQPFHSVASIFTGKISISSRLPKFSYMDHSDPAKKMATGHASDHTSSHLLQPLAVHIIWVEKEEPQSFDRGSKFN